jgi:hypothetical protein
MVQHMLAPRRRPPLSGKRLGNREIVSARGLRPFLVKPLVPIEREIPLYDAGVSSADPSDSEFGAAAVDIPVPRFAGAGISVSGIGKPERRNSSFMVPASW